MMADVRASDSTGSLMLVWLPVNACMALLWGDPAAPAWERTVVRVYRTKDDAWSDWRRITGTWTPKQMQEAK